RRSDIGHCDVAVIAFGDLEPADAARFGIERPLASVRIPYPQASLFDVAFAADPIRLARIAAQRQIARIIDLAELDVSAVAFEDACAGLERGVEPMPAFLVGRVRAVVPSRALIGSIALELQRDHSVREHTGRDD